MPRGGGGVLQHASPPNFGRGSGAHLTRTGRRRTLLHGGTWSPLQGFPRSTRTAVRTQPGRGHAPRPPGPHPRRPCTHNPPMAIPPETMTLVPASRHPDLVPLTHTVARGPMEAEGFLTDPQPPGLLLWRKELQHGQGAGEAPPSTPIPPRGDWPERRHLKAAPTTWEPGPGDLPYFSHLLA